MVKRDLICILAIGSVGDILPLAQLAIQLSNENTNIVIASHIHHQSWLLPLVEPAGVFFRGLSLPPARIWNKNSQPGTQHVDQHLEACIAICEQALGVQIKAPVQTAATEAKQEERCSATARKLIVHNLFALEAFHIAEALRVPSVVVSACLPYPPPVSFQARLKAAYPRLWDALQHKGEGVSWAEIEHWMWPLFTERWGVWRQQRLNLPAVPYQTASRLPPAPLLLLCLSPQLVNQPANWPSSIEVCGSCKPLAYGTMRESSRQCPDMNANTNPQRDSGGAAAAKARKQAEGSLKDDHGSDTPSKSTSSYDRGNTNVSSAPYSPGCGHLLGTSEAAITGPLMWPAGSINLDDASCEKNLLDDETPLICMDFGSMGSMGLLGDATRLVNVMALALKQSGLRGVLLTGQWDALLTAHKDFCQNSNSGALAVTEGFVDHAQLFSRCCALVHHGGAGTVAAALRAGLPSVVYPLQFDQFMWADKLEHMNLARVLPGRDLLESSAEEAAAKLSAALSAVVHSDAMRSSCQQMQSDISAEDGAAVAASHIREALHSQPYAEAIEDDLEQELVCLPNGWEVHASSPSEAHFLYREIFQDHCYLQHGITVQEGDVVVDVGANIGLFSLYLLSRERGERPEHIWALEPLPPSICHLSKNLEAFGAEAQVSIVPVALGSSAGTAPFTYYPRMPGNSTSRPAEKEALQSGCMHASRFEGASTYACQVITLDDFMHHHAVTQIDLLKVDVEGDEEDVLLGLSQWEGVAQVVVEVHCIQGRMERVKTLLESHGFLVVVDQGLAPNTAMIYAAREDRLLGVMEHA